MAEDAPVKEAGNFLTHKLGPLPLGVWMLAAGGIWFYVKGRAGKAGAAGPRTDPAGNVGTIDPKTGYVYGSTQDSSALGGIGGGSGGGGSDGTTGPSGSTVAGQYADNNAWARAAINFLVGIGVDPTSANSAVTQYITSQTLTTDQQGQVNLAIQAIGAPPTPPTPGNAPPPVVTPPGGTVYATNPPTGLTVTDKTSSTIGLRWNKATNAQAYTVSYATGNAPESSQTVSGTEARVTLTGLQPDSLYNIRVQGTPAKQGAGSAQTSASTSAATPAPVTSPNYTPPPMDTHPTSRAGTAVPANLAPPPPSAGVAGGIPLPGYYGQDANGMFWDGGKWIYT